MPGNMSSKNFLSSLSVVFYSVVSFLVVWYFSTLVWLEFWNVWNVFLLACLQLCLERGINDNAFDE